jgi:hypothetical protein
MTDKKNPWEDDSAFKNLSRKEGLMLSKLSWHCASMECEACDGRIRYHVRRFKYTEWDAKTGKTEDKFEEFEWDTSFQSVQLEGGVIQSRENTPEGSRCECFCHRTKKISGDHPVVRRSIGEMVIEPYVQREGKKVSEMLSAEEKEKLK